MRNSEGGEVWKKAIVSVEYIDYHDTEDCHASLMSKDMFIERDIIRGMILKEAYGLCSCEEVGEIHDGDRIAIVNGHAFITNAKSWEKVRTNYFDFS